ncbi:glycosyltransferase family 87 protein [Cupriavidus sp. WKF15]|uniref:glycosyltransferase family 87 protein n=1 Tax=Cupriavidus sp. WKF15 TaxID=3032282 RepID=UPI0023E2F7DE|nr:glycosyltransferase family 87 protein [Cupriavidus sp. WKF15]WER46717.1 glycosyltransferase family 87 protein [Cupriavidus sp. WKF15]
MSNMDHGSTAILEAPASRHWLNLERVRFYSLSMLLVYLVFMVLWAWESKGFTSDRVVRPGGDYSVFWSASYLVLKHSAAQVYDYASLKPVIMAFGAVKGDGNFYLPWLYPPTYLLLVLPLSLLPFAVSYVLFIFGTAAIYVTALFRILDLEDVPRHLLWLPVIAFPGVLEAAMIGQNALLTAGIAAWSLIQLRRRPVVAGMLIGVLSVKPQLAIVFPIAMIAAGEWKPFFVAAATALTMAALSIVLFGWQPFSVFLADGRSVAAHVLEQGERGWFSSPTVFAMMRTFGASVPAAYVAQLISAAFGIVVLVKVWRGQTPMALRVAVVAAATVLITPYLWFYELTWLGIAIAGMTVDCVRRGWMTGERELLAAAWLLPFFLGLNRLAEVPQFGPVVTLLLMAAILRRARQGIPEPGR